MEQPISNASLTFNCQQNWDNMSAAPGGRFCNSCQKKVYDFTDKDAAYFNKILAESSCGVCGRFNLGQLAPAPNSSKWRKWAAAAMVLIGISSFIQKAKAQLIGEVVIPRRPAAVDSNRNMLMGKIAFSKEPEFPGGKVALARFLTKTFSALPGTPDGQLLLRFMVQKDGSLRDIQVIKGIGTNSNKEALRVMKLSPKWIPGHAGLPAIEMAYVLPLNFKNGKVTLL